MSSNILVTGGPFYVLRTCNSESKSYGSFQWPELGHVECPDWVENKECGNGLHGFLNGEGDGGLANWTIGARWLVLKVDAYVDLGDKVKFPSAEVLYNGDRLTATTKLRELIGGGFAIIGSTMTAGNDGTATAGYGGTAIAGDRGTAIAGYGGAAIAGYRGTAIAGYGGAATAGYWGTATAGNNGTATAGDGGIATAGDGGAATAGSGGAATVGNNGTATTGDDGTATAGIGGTATAGDYGTIIIKYRTNNRYRLAVGYIGENGLKPNVKYRLDQNHKFVEA